MKILYLMEKKRLIIFFLRDLGLIKTLRRYSLHSRFDILALNLTLGLMKS